ncbi:MAG TPA: hypothetical protein VFY93_03285 [Planctomycetota bacterium]|nr:hypothetical protein [Planctomycetota bacterium]
MIRTSGHRAILLLAGALALGLSTSPVAAGKGKKHEIRCSCRDVDPDDFTCRVDNKYFPLKPGTTYDYESSSGETEEVYVTCDTKEILGVTCVVVHDVVYDEDGEWIEDTYDWYAQDKCGNVWYFGEDSTERDPETGETDTEGSWEAGVDGAEPGIIMLACPHKGDTYREEYYEGEAEDMAKVKSLHASASVEYGTFHHVLLTLNFTALEPDVLEKKYYAKGVGLVLEEEVKGGDDVNELVAVTYEDCGGDDCWDDGSSCGDGDEWDGDSCSD